MLLAETEYAKVLRNLNYILIGGEAFPERLLHELNKLVTGTTRIFNVYGPTETTVWSSVKEMTDVQLITIGRPIKNTDLYLLNEVNALQLRNCIGEIAIGGYGVSHGYINNEGLTKERFIKPDFADTTIYKTGDMGKWSEAGELICLGRNDDQVKVRGYRIELGEIENSLLTWPGVKAAAVIAREINGAMSVFAFIQSAGTADQKEIMNHLCTILPDYMLPSQIIDLEQIPLMKNGKADRRALAGMQISIELNTVPKTTGNETEVRIRAIWEEVLGYGEFGYEQSFFDVGGNSILLMQVLRGIEKRFGISVPVADLYELKTVERMAGYVLNLQKPMHRSFAAFEVKPQFLSHGAGTSMTVLPYPAPGTAAEFIDGFLSIMGALLNYSEIELTVSISPNLYAAGTWYLSRDLTQQWAAMRDWEYLPREAYMESACSENSVRLLLADGYRVNQEDVLKTFQIVINREHIQADSVVLLCDNAVVNANAVKYIGDRTIAAVEKKVRG